MNELIKKLGKVKGKFVEIGFGRTNKRIVLMVGENGVTFYGSDEDIGVARPERITTMITPDQTVCEDFRYTPQLLFFKLGRNRLLAHSYCGKNDIHTVYLPDEQDISFQRSEFIRKSGNRGLW